MGTYEIPASVGQRLLGMMDHYRPGYGALNCPVLCQLRGALDTAALRAALDELTARHEALRTTFAGRGPGLTQLVHEPLSRPLTEVDLRGATDPAASLDDAVAAELRKRIDVTEWPTRATLWRVGDRDHVLCFNMHHLVTDAWSCGILFTELRALLAGRDGQPAALPDPVWQYRDFVRWQQELMAGTGLDRHREYWRRQLHGARLPHLPSRAGTATGEPTDNLDDVGGRDRVDLAPSVVGGLRRIGRTMRTTPFTVALALYYTVLRQVTGESDLAVASLFANRSRAEARQTVGFLANMVLLRARLPEAGTFSDLVQQAHATVIGAFAHQEQPFQTLPLDTLGGAPRRADDVVFQMMAEVQHRAGADGIELELLVPDGIGSRFGLELALAPRGEAMRAVLFYAPQLDPSLAAKILSGYASAAARVVADPAIPLSRLAIGESL